MISKRWAWLAAAAVLFAGLTNAHAHVHFCFDGQEAPAAVHIADSFDHHGPLDHDGHHGHSANGGTRDGASSAPGGDHDDLDVDISNSAVAKSVKYDLAVIAPAPFGTLRSDQGRRDSLHQREQVAPAAAPLYSRPPLRGPPH